MEDKNTDLEIMRKAIEMKRQKSASQTSVKRGPGERYNAGTQGKKRDKKKDPNSASDSTDNQMD